jgi:hypothetical protein
MRTPTGWLTEHENSLGCEQSLATLERDGSAVGRDPRQGRGHAFQHSGVRCKGARPPHGAPGHLFTLPHDCGRVDGSDLRTYVRP